MKYYKQSKFNSNQALSLILTLLIISSILTGTVLIGDVMIRHNQVVKGTEISEKAYFAAESATEKALYQILKNYVNTSTYTLDGVLDNAAEYLIDSGDIEIDDNCPGAPVECASGDITNANFWTISLLANQSFQLDLDIDGATYPTSLTISKAGDEPSDLLVYECTTEAGPPRVCSSESSQVFKISFPYSFSLSASSKFYRIRINNLGTSTESYTLTPGNNTLPIGINVRATGVYSGYERKLVNIFPKWQKFGVD